MNSFLDRTAFKLYEKKSGRHTLKKLDELNRTQWLSRDALMELQHSKLQRLVEYAYRYVPYYQRTFDEVGFTPSDLRSDIASLTKLPILTKSIVRENWNDLLTTEPDRRQRLRKSSTSGSTGQPLILMQDSDFRDGDNADVLRRIGWAGWKSGEWQAWIWGWKARTNNPGMTQKILSWLIDWAQKRFMINAYTLTDQTMTALAQRIRRQRPSILYGFASSLHNFAQFIKRSPFQDITFKGIFSTAEVLPASVRGFIEDTFRTRVFNSYASIDLGGIACECEAHTGQHVSMENNYVEILSNGYPAEPGEVGDIIVTNLDNLGMPFIRFSIGDAGAWYAGENCPCGRVSSMLQAIEGRSGDTFKTRDGRIVSGCVGDLDFLHDALSSIKQFQVVQKSLDDIVFRLVPDGEIPQPVLDQISHTIRGVLGENVVVHFEFLDAIQPLPSGKHRYAVSEVK
jgi:phenylacetate-CoA ligase